MNRYDPPPAWAVRLLRRVGGDSAARRLIARKLPAAIPVFDAGWYSSRYPDIRSSGCDPLVHYMAFGAAEGRDPHPLFNTSHYIGRHPEAKANPFAHYLMAGAARRYTTHAERGFCLIPPLGRPLRILTLLLRYGTDKYGGADERLERLLTRAFPGAERYTVIIDNALPRSTGESLSSTRMLIGGDNTAWEFSGWDRGVQFIGSRLGHFDFVHFATDAFEQFDDDFAEQFNTPVLEALRFGPAMAGHIDYLNEPSDLFGYKVECWVRSSFFFIRPVEVQALGSMVSVPDRSGLFTGDAAQPFQPGSPLDPRLAHSLTSWLTGEGMGQGVQWHSRFALTADTLPFFENKIVAILNEQLLSQRLRSLGCWIADVRWLRNVIEGEVGGRLFEESWHNQVTQRR